MAIIIIERYQRIIIWTFQKRKQHYHVEYSIETSIFCILSHNRFRISPFLSRKSHRDSRAFIYFFAYFFCADAALFFIFFVHKYLLWCICVCVCVCKCVWCIMKTWSDARSWCLHMLTSRSRHRIVLYTLWSAARNSLLKNNKNI